ncbi:S-layer homology domain-containing protein [Paenibacillus glycanilyticus]|uniref:S-layer homology domain-containing protein n=1 Tax=Paenibacillus glycanilyticus TaxID=126569 RepID=UPI00203DDFB5|nr:S-layer homology domain-containing protein [Paenibacillus glycanilyticus]MCM3626596.1 S-layer homology domain-containing protein [Paenibacillus glycanilyticus]
MARSKAMLSALMALLLLFTAFPAYAADHDNEAVSTVSSGSDSYVRIKNKWKSNYLYEGSDGIVRYGFTAADNGSSHWLMEENGGVTRIKNRATGHYITMEDTDQRRDPLYSRSLATSTADDQWIIADSSRAGYVIIKNAGNPSANLVIHQEDQLGFAEVSGDINITFESPQWALEPVDPAGVPVRIMNQFKAGQYLYEDTEGFVKFGAAGGITDQTTHWYIETALTKEDGSSVIRLKNRATGHYITQGAEGWMQLQATAQDGTRSEWTMADAASAGFVTFTNVYAASGETPLSYVLNTQFPDDTNVRANDWAQPSWGSAQWRIDMATDVQPVRIASYSDDPAGASYLYENNGVVQYGALDSTNAGNYLYQWVIEDYDGRTLIRNVATGHYIRKGAGEPTDPLTADQPAAIDASYQWTLASSNIYDDYKTIQNAAGGYLHNADATGAAQAGTIDPDTNPAQWLLADPSASTDGSPQFVRIMNEWQSMYLYEDLQGNLKYGNLRGEDQRDQWVVERFQGRKRIKNRETNHYINLQNVTDGHIKVSDVEDDWRSAVWVIEDKGGGSRLIHSVLDSNDAEGSQKYVNLQNLTKYAEYGIINPNWGSPRWRFINVPEAAPGNIRIKSKLTGGYLHEVTEAGSDDLGKLKFADVPESDSSSVWFPEDAGDGVGSVRLKNLSTGHYVSMEGVGGTVEQDAPDFKLQAESIYPQWGSAKWYLQDSASEGYVNIKSAWAGHFVYETGGDDAGYAKVSKLVAGNDEGQFAVEEAEVPEAPLPAVPVRIKNAATGQFLYENHGGVVLYGDVAVDNGYSHWLLQGDNGSYRIRNRVTNHYISVDDNYRYITSGEGGAAAAKADWSIEPQGATYLIRSLYGSFDDEYINVQNSAGYAERGLFPASFGTLQWSFENAPEHFTTPVMGDERNEVTGTPIFDDTNFVTISAGGNKLASSNGNAAVTASSGTGNPSAEWLLQDYNGRKLIKNRATGKLLSLDLSLKDSAAITDAEQWVIEERLRRYLLTNAAEKNGALHVDGGQLQYSEEASSALWSLTPVENKVIYEAENAFRSQSITTAVLTGGYTGTGYAAGMASEGDLIRFVVNAEDAGSYEASIRYLASQGGALQLTVNGIPVNAINMTAASSWKEAEVSLDLRAGINTVTLQKGTGGGSLSIDSLSVEDAVNLAYRGATVPYVSYEAEHAATNATLIGPSRVYREMAAEASGRQAVELGETGDYVEFTLTDPANSIVLRYAIPDSADGSGLQETLGLYVNGEFKQKLNLTSKYAWEYGSYPWSNDPKQGSAHRFFDEIHALIGDVPAGATIRLEKDADSTADYYVIDLADMEQVADPLTIPDGFLSVANYGATADDGTDDTAAFNEAMAAAKAAGKGVWFPAGTFELRSSLLHVSDVTIRGAGMWYTTLLGARFIGDGGHIEVYDLLVDGDLNVRDDEASTHGFEGEFGPGSVIQNVWIEHSKTGLWLTRLKGSTGFTDSLHMIGIRMRNLMADGINFCVGTSNSMLEQSDIRYPGDDGIAMWSAEGVASVNNTARFNTVSLPWLADNMVIFGGKDNKMTDNIAKDTITNGAGVAVSTRFNPVPFSGTTVVERNTLIRTGSYDTGYGVNLGAIWVFASEKDLNGTVYIRNNTALDSTYAGLIVHGDFGINGVSIENTVIDGAGTNGVDVTPNVKGSVIADNLIVRGERIAVVNDTNPGFAFEELNVGFASLLKPFQFVVGEDRTGPFELEKGTSASVHVYNRNGEEVTDQAIITTDSNDVAYLDDGELHAARPGTVRVAVSYNGATRVFTLLVTGKEDSNTGTNPNGNSGGNGTDAIPAAEKAEDNDAAVKNKVSGGHSLVTIDVSASAASGKAKFTVKALLELAASKPDTVLVVKNQQGSYTFPLKLLAQILKANGITDTANAIWTFSIQSPPADLAAKLNKEAADQDITTVGHAVDFSITVQSGAQTVVVTSFGGAYVERTMTVEDVQEAAQLTVLVFDPSAGTFSPVPAVRSAKDGKTVLAIKSMGNSIYTAARLDRAFTDTGSHWAKADIALLAGKGILNGVTMGKFEPERAVTRAEFAAMLVRALGIRQIGEARTFKDVAVGSWYEETVRLASGAGIINGYEDGTFRPNSKVTREEMAIMAVKALELATGSKLVAADLNYKDSGQISNWAADAVGKAAGAGLLKGMPDGSFVPAGSVTRAEAATLLKRLLVSAGLLNS